MRSVIWILLLIGVGVMVEGKIYPRGRGGGRKNKQSIGTTDKPNLVAHRLQPEEYYASEEYYEYPEEYFTPDDKENEVSQEENKTEEKDFIEEISKGEVSEERGEKSQVERESERSYKEGDGDGFGIADKPAMDPAIRSLLNIPGLSIDPSLLETLPPEVLMTLARNLANTGGVQQNQKPVAPQEPVPAPVPIEACPDTDKDGIPHYCRNLPDDLYYDPYNPWCGYIECAGGVAKRRVCKRGKWMDTKMVLGKTQKEMCQMPLKLSGGKPCTMHTDMDMCRNAAKVETVEDEGLDEMPEMPEQPQK